MVNNQNFSTKIFADGADLQVIKSLAADPRIKGFTTNPSLMRKAGVVDYEKFCREVIKVIPDHSVSFEVFADDLDGMLRQALLVATWGENVYVKIPVTNTKGVSTGPIIQKLFEKKLKVNITAIMTASQVKEILAFIPNDAVAYISVFAGRVADSGVDPIPTMREVVELLRPYPNVELIWASPREPLNVSQASEIGCDIITITKDILKKLSLVGKDLNEYSLETVRMFYDDAQTAGYEL